VFYDTGSEPGGDGNLLAFWDLHDSRMNDFDPAISTGLGLQPWVNHIAFAARDLDDIAARRERWLAAGHDVIEIDHGFCTSIYTMDPNQILVEWCTDTKPYTDADRAHALDVLLNPAPELEDPPMPQVHRAPAKVS
jgi:hypothetical protein